MKRTKDSTAKIEPKLNQTENSPRSRKSKKDHSRDERIEKKKKNSLSGNFTEDIIHSSQSSVVPKKKSRLNNCNSERRIAGSLTTELLEPASSGEPRFKELPLNSPESCVELGEKGSGDYNNDSVEKKDRQKRRIPFIVDSESHFNQDYDIIENEKPYYQTHVEPNRTNHDDDRKKSKLEVHHRSTWDMSFPDFLSPVGKPHTADAKTEPGMLKKDRKRKRKEKVEKKITNTLLAMIHDSTSSSDDEATKTNDCSIATLNKGNTRKHNKSIVSQILSTSIEDEESHSNTKHVRKFISNPKTDKTSDNHESENQESERDCFRDNQQGRESFKAIRSKKLPADTALNCSLLNISIENVKTEPNGIGKYEKHKAADKVKKKKANTLLAMIHGSSSSSDSDDEIQKIDVCFVETLDKGNTRKHNKSKISKILSSSDEDEESHSSKTKRVRKSIPSSTSNKTSNNHRSESRESDKEFSQDNKQGFEFVRAIKSEKLPADTASDYSLPNISVEHVKTQSDLIEKYRKHEAKEKVKKEKANTLLAMIHDSTSSTDSDDEIQKIDDCLIETLNKEKPEEHNKSRVSQILLTGDKDEESHCSKTKRVRKFISSSTSNKTSDNHRSESRESDKEFSDDNKQGSEFVAAMRSEELPADRASNDGLLNNLVEHIKTEPGVIGEDRKHKAEKEMKRKKGNSLLAIIGDSACSSDPDNETKKIDVCSVETLDKGHTRKHNKSKISKILSSSDKDEESHSTKTKRVRKSIPSSTSNKTSENHRSESRESDKEFSQDNKQGFEFVRAMKSEKLPADTASDCGLPNISVEHVKTQPDLIEKYKKHKAKEKVEKEKANTLLTMIHDSASSADLNDEIEKIDHSSEESVDKVNSRKSTKFRVSETFYEEKGDEASSEQSFKNSSAMSPEFDLEEEAKDVEELISAMEEEEQIPNATMTRLFKLRIRLKHTVSPQHQVETRAGSRGPTPRQKKIIEKFGPIKYGKFAPEEDDVIVKNWKSFCKLHDWDPSDVKPFLYMRHQNVGLIAKFSERRKFVQFLADGLPWRTLYSVYWRFRNLYQPHIQTKYTDDEDKLIIAHMENSSAKKNVRKFSELGKILNRTRHSVWRRYRLLKKKRNPHEKLKWSLHLVKKVIKNLMQLTLSNDVCQLKDLDIPLVVWKKLSKKFKIDNTDLKQFWLKKLHMQLFCQEPVYLNDVKIKLIEYFHATGISESWEIEWPSVAKHFDGMTSIFLSRIFGGLVRNPKYEGMAFGEIIEHLYEVKKPELQKARKDKCLPRVVFKDGNVKLLDVKVNNGSKRKTVKSEDLSD